METILIADDQEIVRSGVRMIIESFPEKYTIFEATTCAEVIQALFEGEINFTILDLFLADGNIFPAIHEFKQRKVSILVYSASAEKIYARRLLKKGVRGFISKQASIAELEKAIGCLLEGEIYLSRSMKKNLFIPGHADLLENPIDLLSDRELEVAEYVAMGMSTGEIAQRMRLDLATIGTYRRRMFTKLHVSNSIELRDKFLFYKMQG